MLEPVNGSKVQVTTESSGGIPLKQSNSHAWSQSTLVSAQPDAILDVQAESVIRTSVVNLLDDLLLGLNEEVFSANVSDSLRVEESRYLRLYNLLPKPVQMQFITEYQKRFPKRDTSESRLFASYSTEARTLLENSVRHFCLNVRLATVSEYFASLKDGFSDGERKQAFRKVCSKDRESIKHCIGYGKVDQKKMDDYLQGLVNALEIFYKKKPGYLVIKARVE